MNKRQLICSPRLIKRISNKVPIYFTCKRNNDNWTDNFLNIISLKLTPLRILFALWSITSDFLHIFIIVSSHIFVASCYVLTCVSVKKKKENLSSQENCANCCRQLATINHISGASINFRQVDIYIAISRTSLRYFYEDIVRI